ncbi:HNH endonuclease signature motif containing protein [Cellulomonas sp. PS-H5]|uniref:HNH endonuclease signature motif containing protein n=1 Tax=Cellulomonas sp. PS-H5 TaxID=2820400 RepID=UPI001C4F0F26|nr:HNH endonuclease signature motif containing protein [Cellulomonas sp. PS-H5]MBW0252618.1 HNH endonuclease [Cellulomonas sp. PS-H5]
MAEFLDPGLPRSERLTEALDRTPTGVPLARLLGALDPRSLDDFDLAEVAAGFTRMSGWAHAGLAAVAVELARRQGMGPRLDPRAPRGRGSGLTSQRVAAMTLSARLKRSPQDTAALIREGADFAGALAETGAALRQGRISVPAARVIAARLGDQVAWVSGPVQDYVLPRAPHSTVAQVRVDLERALLRVDPEHAQDRRDTARAARRVTHPRALPDQMAEMHLVLPAEHAIGIDTALHGAARSARAAGDPRTLDQLRTDTLVDCVLTGTPATALAAAGASPAATPGYLPGPRDTEAPPSEAASGADAPTSTPSGVGRAGTRDPRTHVLVTVPLSTLIGRDDSPADLAGFGPIDATTARALAQGGVWRRLVTDDLSGTVLDVGRTTYRPPAALADHVRHRDRTCTFPGCPVPAHHCDLDHTEDWAPAPDDPHPPGTTSHTNLGPTCPRHHRAKHHARFTLQQPEPGTHDWTDPTGHTYRTRPGTDHPTQHLTGPRRLRTPPPDTPPDPPAPAISPDTPPSGVPSDSSTSGAPRGAAAPHTPAPRPPAPRSPAPRPPAPHASDDDPPPY